MIGKRSAMTNHKTKRKSGTSLVTGFNIEPVQEKGGKQYEEHGEMVSHISIFEVKESELFNAQNLYNLYMYN